MTTNAMNCELFSDQLMAYLENEVDDVTRSAIERHSVTCAECGALMADLRKLRFDASNLPTLKPSRDLWSGIAARIETPVLDIGTAREATVVPASVSTRRWWRSAVIAASLVGAAGIGYFAAGAKGNQTVGSPVAEGTVDSVTNIAVVPDTALPVPPSAESREPRGIAATPAAAPAAPTEVELALKTLTGDYDREITRLRALIEERRNQLDPVTVAVIEKNLKVIDTAVEDCKKAIVRDPASRFLIESLNQSLQTKVELMRTAALLPSRT